MLVWILMNMGSLSWLICCTIRSCGLIALVSNLLNCYCRPIFHSIPWSLSCSFVITLINVLLCLQSILWRQRRAIWTNFLVSIFLFIGFIGLWSRNWMVGKYFDCWMLMRIWLGDTMFFCFPSCFWFIKIVLWKNIYLFNTKN